MQLNISIQVHELTKWSDFTSNDCHAIFLRIKHMEASEPELCKFIQFRLQLIDDFCMH